MRGFIGFVNFLGLQRSPFSGTKNFYRSFLQMCGLDIKVQSNRRISGSVMLYSILKKWETKLTEVFSS